jgi:murein tripeptide amidase MpaA
MQPRLVRGGPALAGLSLCLCLLPAARADEPAAVRYDGHTLVRARLTDRAQLDALAARDAVILNCRVGIGELDVVVSPDDLAWLRDAGIAHEVRHENVQALIDAERRRLDAAAAAADATAGPVDVCDTAWWSDYKPLADINTRVDELVSAYPALVQKLTVNALNPTHEGRSFFAMRITGTGGPASKPAVLFNSCQHAREWVSPMTTMYIATQLLCQYGSDPEVTALMDAVEFLIVPIVNPDGYLYSWGPSRLWRKNRRDNGGGDWGVDLNRNWSVDWGGPESTSSDPGNDLYYGPSAFSEPETQAMRDFILARPQIVAHVDFHSYSQVILQPWGYTNTLPPDYDEVHALGGDMSAAALAVNGFAYPHGSGDSLLYLASGTFSDWSHSQGPYAYTIELRPSDFGGGGFELPPTEILPTAEENFAAIRAMADWATRPVQLRAAGTLPATVPSDTATPVSVDIRETYGTVQPGTETLHARPGSSGAFASQPLAAAGGDTWEGVLPAAPCGTIIEFYFEVQATDGTIVRWPSDAPAAVHAATAADVRVELADDFEADLGWFAENYGASTGDWQRGTPVDDPGWAYDPAADGDGSGQCFLTQNAAGNTDVDGGAVGLVSPELDLSDGNVAISYDYYLYLSDSDGSDRLLVEISANQNLGPWTEIARHDTHGGLDWRPHTITQADLDAAGVTLSATMRVRFTANDAGTASIVEAGVDGFEAATATCTVVAGDATGDGVVDVSDILEVLGTWGPCPPTCPADVDGSGAVDVGDLLLVLANWS